ncbi:hypothetical protein IAU60_005101 [Kwoniella sp. DSM 27419]
MSHLIPIASTVLIPLTSLTSFTIYLSTHRSSPVRHLFHRGQIELPTHTGEGLDGSIEKDAFDIDDPVVCQDGTPVDPDRFWQSMHRRKLAVLFLMTPPLVVNILLLVFTILSSIHGDERLRATLLPSLLLPAQIVTIVLTLWHLGQNETYSHWATTIHLSVDIFMQFLVLAILALMPSTPMPGSQHRSMLRELAVPQGDKRIQILQPLLPILYLLPLFAILSIRRGPPLYLPLSAIYPAKIVDAVPEDADALDPSKPNVSAEVQATVPEWLLFGYATSVIRKGYVAESLDVWDLPILPKGLRSLYQYKLMKAVYGRPKGRFGRWEGFNLLWKLAKVNKALLIARKIKLQLNTMLFSKTLRKKDIAAAGDDKGHVGGVKEEAAKDKAKDKDEEDDEDDEAVSSKTQIMRTALMNEILQGIRMLKFMAWERSFEKRIQEVRKNELSWQARNYQIEVAFNCFVSCRRIEKYLSLAEVDPVEANDGQGDVVLTAATYAWPSEDATTTGSTAATTVPSASTSPKPTFTLADLTLRFPKGKLSLICGRLAGLLGEADLVAGQVVCPRSSADAMDQADPKVAWVVPNMVAYVPQQAWLQNASIKDNIIFSSPWDAQRYQQVIEACSLATDLEILEDGDQTGGQKARGGFLFGRRADGKCLSLEPFTVVLDSCCSTTGDVKFAGTRDDFVASGLMNKLDEEDKPKEEKPVEEAEVKPAHKSVVSLSAAAGGSEPGSETSSIAPDDEATLTNSASDIKHKTPRKLIEDEKRARGRIAWNVWKTYFGISLGGVFLSNLQYAFIYYGSLQASRKLHNVVRSVSYGLAVVVTFVTIASVGGWPFVGAGAFTELTREAPEFVEPRPPASWPERGAITVEKLIIRYAVQPREKIGIVGATGCGKSTLALSFFRFVEATEGRIVIDGVDIAKIGLTDLRSRVTIIPQDPTILSGTLRSTLDVFDEYDDADIYAALRRVHLIKDEPEDDEVRNKNVFTDLSNPVSEGGDNFSSGEKQLIW